MARTGSPCGSGFNNSFVTGVTRIYGQGRMGVYANAPGANTTFYLVRLLPGAAGRNLVLNFFDTGDAASPGTITVLPPADSNVGASFSGLHVHAATRQQHGPTVGDVHGHRVGLQGATT